MRSVSLPVLVAVSILLAAGGAAQTTVPHIDVLDPVSVPAGEDARIRVLGSIPHNTIFRLDGNSLPAAAFSDGRLQIDGWRIVRPGLYELEAMDPVTSVVSATEPLQVHLDIRPVRMVYDELRGRIYCSGAPPAAGQFAPSDSIVVVNPAAGAVERVIPLGREVRTLAISADGQFLYATAPDTAEVISITLDTFDIGPAFSVWEDRTQPPPRIHELAVSPADPEALIVCTGTGASDRGAFAAVFRRGIRQGEVLNGWLSSPAFSPDGNTLYGVVAGWPSNVYLAAMEVTPEGLRIEKQVSSPYGSRVALQGGYLFTSRGRILEAASLTLVASPGVGGAVIPDVPGGRVFYLTGASYREPAHLVVFDLKRYLAIGDEPVPGASRGSNSESPDFVRWGEDGFAYVLSSGELALLRTRVARSVPEIASAGVVNAASFETGGVVPGEIVSIFGERLGPDRPRGPRLDAPNHIASSTASVEAYFDEIPATLLYVSRRQLNVVVPYGLSQRRQVHLRIYDHRVPSRDIRFDVLRARPGLFTRQGSGTGQVAAINQDGSLNGPESPAARASVVALYATGEGETSPAGTDGLIATDVLPAPVMPVSATVGGVSADVYYAGAAPGLVAGVFQVNIKIPEDAPAGSATPVRLRVGDAASSAETTIAVQ